MYAMPDLARADGLGIDLSEGGSHVGRGTRNLLAGLGDGAYLEVIGPDPDQPEPDEPRPFGIDELTEPRLVAWAVRVRDIHDVVGRAKTKGYDPGPVLPMSRRRPDGVLLEWQLTPMTAGIMPFLIDWGGTPHPTESLPPGQELVSLTGFHPTPEEVHKGLEALGEHLVVNQGPFGLLAVLRTPNGEVVLR
ncbi:VOC family protein [Kibdelosporangium persicum]|uniref:VOC domain-containing protein n=1 Tax=Kibdelosporangium persicum TaxID=2698649 RepID=A0ABX2FKR3_9PSEU|nr:VOC domain-containing protein [Kibdelosporangium persicum]